MSQNFLGRKYILKKSENFDACLKELGVGLILRKMGNTVIPQCVLEQNDYKTYTFTLETPYQKSCICFELDKEFTEITLDNRKVKTICHLNGNVYVQEQKAEEGMKSTKIVRSYVDNEIIVVVNVGGIKAVRVYEVLKETDES